MLDVEFAQASDTGRVRPHNEDSIGAFCPENPAQVRSHGWLFVLADGVGGQEMGEVASRTTVDCVLAGFRESPGHEPHSSLLPRLLREANTQVFEAGLAAAPAGVRMATTAVACALRLDRALVAHVGDSRCYLVRHGQTTLLTRDHTVAGEQMRMGLLSAEEAAQSSTRHLLSRSLGMELFVNVETNSAQIVPNDTLVLCSDGLHGSVTAQEIGRTVASSSTLEAAAQSLIQMANERDGSDNISVQLARIRGVERTGMYRGRPYRLK